MGTLIHILMIIFYIITIDMLARIIPKYSRNLDHFKPPGLIAQGILALTKKPSLLKDKEASLKRYFLALATLFALLFAMSHLTTLNQAVLQHKPKLFLALVPVFALPFYHFVYGSQTASFINMQASLKSFRLRGVLSILLAGNMVFLQMELAPSWSGIFAHGILAFLSLVCSFHLCAQILQKPSPNNFGDLEDHDCGQPAFLHYFVACAEMCFYVILFHLVFLQPYMAVIEDLPAWVMNNNLLIFAVIFAAGLTTKFFFYHRSPWTLEFFEETLLPLSFLIFATISFVQINF